MDLKRIITRSFQQSGLMDFIPTFYHKQQAQISTKRKPTRGSRGIKRILHNIQHRNWIYEQRQQRGVNVTNLISIPAHDIITGGLINARSINNKEEEIRDLSCYDFLAITETWMKSNTPDFRMTEEAICPPDYKLIHKQRENGKRGGGLGLLVKECAKPSVLKYSGTASSFENLMVRLFDFILAILYRPPNTNVITFLEELDGLLSFLYTSNKKIVLVGDVNIHLETSNSNAVAYHDLLESYSLLNLTTKPTHTGGHVLNTVVACRGDVILIDTTDVCLSDHYLVTYAIKKTMNDLPKKKSQQSAYTFRDFKSVDREAFTTSLGQSLTPHNIAELDTDEASIAIQAAVVTILDKLAPEQKRTSSLKKQRYGIPWSAEVHQAKTEKNRLQRQFNKSGLTIHKQILNEQTKRVRHLAQAEKEFYYSEMLSGCESSKDLYNFYNQCSRTKSALPHYSSDANIAEDFGEFFINKVARITAEFELVPPVVNNPAHDEPSNTERCEGESTTPYKTEDYCSPPPAQTNPMREATTKTGTNIPSSLSHYTNDAALSSRHVVDRCDGEFSALNETADYRSPPPALSNPMREATTNTGTNIPSTLSHYTNDAPLSSRHVVDRCDGESSTLNETADCRSPPPALSNPMREATTNTGTNIPSTLSHYTNDAPLSSRHVVDRCDGESSTLNETADCRSPPPALSNPMREATTNTGTNIPSSLSQYTNNAPLSSRHIVDRCDGESSTLNETADCRSPPAALSNPMREATTNTGTNIPSSLSHYTNDAALSSRHVVDRCGGESSTINETADYRSLPPVLSNPMREATTNTESHEETSDAEPSMSRTTALAQFRILSEDQVSRLRRSKVSRVVDHLPKELYMLFTVYVFTVYCLLYIRNCICVLGQFYSSYYLAC